MHKQDGNSNVCLQEELAAVLIKAVGHTEKRLAKLFSDNFLHAISRDLSADIPRGSDHEGPKSK